MSVTLPAADGISIQPSCYSRLTNHWVCLDYLRDRHQDLSSALVQHLQITAAALVFSIIIAFPLALLAPAASRACRERSSVRAPPSTRSRASRCSRSWSRSRGSPPARS